MKRIISSPSFQSFRLFVVAVFLLSVSLINKVSAQEIPVLEWAKSMGGSQGDFGQDIAIDASGNVYSTGRHYATGDFDPGTSVFNLTTPGGDHNVFVSKVDTNGNFVWAKSMGGSNTDYGYSIAVDASGNVFTTGHFAGTADFDPGPGTFNLTSAGGNDDIFVSKLDTDGNFVWAVRIGSTFLDYAYNMTIDNTGNIYITGLFRGTVDFDPGAAVFNITSSTGTANNAYILKLDTDSNFVWAKAFVGSNTIGNAVFVDALLNVYAVGYFVGTTDFNPGTSTFNLTASGIEYAFITKLDVNGDFVWAKSFGGSNNTRIADVTVDGGGSIYTTGYFLGTTDFDPGAGIDNHTSVGTTDIFISKLDSNGDFIWAKPLGGTSNDYGLGIITDAGGNVLTSGYFRSTIDFDPGPGVFNLTSAGGYDIFLSKLDSNGNHVWAVRAGANTTFDDAANAITIDPSGTIYLAGNFSGTVDFDYGTCVANLISVGQTDVFIQKINIGSILPPPTITSFTPISGSVGSSVIITGTNFDTTPTNNEVTFNGTVAVVTGSTATNITTTVPAGATTGKISVAVNCVTVQSTTDFTVTTGSTQNFITQWNLATAGSGATQLSFGTATSGTATYTWQQLPTGASGSGSWSGATVTITGLPAGSTIRLQIAPTNFQRININNGTDRNRLTQVEQWGTTAWTSMQTAFRNCLNLQITATDLPNLTGVTNMSEMFSGCDILNSPSNIGSWNTGVVTTMQRMFANTDAFNQNIGAWNTAAVTNMSEMFSSARAFNQPIGGWNTAAVTNMSGMFFYADVFNQDIGAWNTSAVTNMSDMFTEAYVFNQNIGAWNTGAVTNMANMFSDAIAFNQVISSWNTAAVTNMSGMFKFASVFNQNIEAWNTAAVTTMSQMFSRASAFNQNLSSWNTGAVTSMLGMFEQATAFNQNIGAWTLNPGVDLRFMFDNNGMECNNYSATLIGWSANPSTPNGRSLGATGRQYGTNAVAARSNLDITKSWTIAGDAPSGTTCGSVSLPTITSFNPTSGSIGTTVTITGTNFSTTPANNTVSFNGTTAIVTASTATSITTTLPVGATTGLITVTASGNTAVSATIFTVTASPVITITTHPSDFIACVGQTATFTTAATGTTNLAYQWQFSPDGIVPFTDIANGGGYSNATTAALSVNTTGNFGVGRYRCRINGDFAAEVITNDEGLFINPIPTAPTATNTSRCGPGSVTLTATGGSNGQYRWYTGATGGTAITGEVNSSYTTPVLTTTTSYFVAVDDGSCESLRTPVVATINIPPSVPIITSSIPAVGNTLTICSSTSLTLSAPQGFSSYSWSNGATTSQINVSTSGSYTVIVTNGAGCSSPASAMITVTVVPAPCNNSAPVINNTTLSTTIGNTVSIDLSTLISDADNNLVLSTLTILQQPTSGAQASLNGTTLQINYAGNSFTGIDVITIRVCDVFGECTTQQLQINVIGEIEIFNGVSNNNDGKNDFFKIQNIELLEPENTVTIYNRWGSKVFETENYSEVNAFRGLTNNGNELPSGTYFYKIVLKSSKETKTGYLALKR